jgi:hypothetical protein
MFTPAIPVRGASNVTPINAGHQAYKKVSSPTDM